MLPHTKIKLFQVIAISLTSLTQKKQKVGALAFDHHRLFMFFRHTLSHNPVMQFSSPHLQVLKEGIQVYN